MKLFYRPLGTCFLICHNILTYLYPHALSYPLSSKGKNLSLYSEHRNCHLPETLCLPDLFKVFPKPGGSVNLMSSSMVRKSSILRHSLLTKTEIIFCILKETLFARVDLMVYGIRSSCRFSNGHTILPPMLKTTNNHLRYRTLLYTQYIEV